MKTMILKLIIYIFMSFELIKCKQISKREQLLFDLLVKDEYNVLVRPGDKDDRTRVETQLKLLQIDLDEKYQRLISTVWLEMMWNDSRLSWNPNDYNNITEITLPVNKIWIPDIVLQNGVGMNDYLNEYKLFNPWITSVGLVTWVPEVKLHTKCYIKVKDFPFDVQCCEINFYSWAHTASQMIIKQYGNKNTTNLTHLAYNTEWVIYDTCAANITITTSQDLDWWVNKYVMRIKRESIYHIYTLLMPCVVLSIMSVLLFCLPPDSDEKTTLGVTILLAFFVNSVVVSNYTPEAMSELPVIALYYTFNIFHMSISLAFSVLVLRFHFRGHRLNRVPNWMKKLVLMDSKKYFAERDALLNSKRKLNLIAFNNETFENKVWLTRKVINSEYMKTNDKNLSLLSKLIKEIRRFIKDIEDQNKAKRTIEEIKIEWKEFARRFEFFLFLVGILSIFFAPLILFHEYFTRDNSLKVNFDSKCGCDY